MREHGRTQTDTDKKISDKDVQPPSVSVSVRQVGVRDYWKKGQTDGRNRTNIKAGERVLIVLKQDQRSGKTTEGIVKDILTKSPSHPHGMKVRLVTGEVGRVKSTSLDNS